MSATFVNMNGGRWALHEWLRREACRGLCTSLLPSCHPSHVLAKIMKNWSAPSCCVAPPRQARARRRPASAAAAAVAATTTVAAAAVTTTAMPAEVSKCGCGCVHARAWTTTAATAATTAGLQSAVGGVCIVATRRRRRRRRQVRVRDVCVTCVYMCVTSLVESGRVESEIGSDRI